MPDRPVAEVGDLRLRKALGGRLQLLQAGYVGPLSVQPLEGAGEARADAVYVEGGDLHWGGMRRGDCAPFRGASGLTTVQEPTGADIAAAGPRNTARHLSAKSKCQRDAEADLSLPSSDCFRPVADVRRVCKVCQIIQAIVADAGMTGRDERVRIVAIPDGEAPLWVRERWVGLELPIYPDQRGPETTLGHGVLSGPPPMTLDDFEAGRRGRLVVMSGYFVKAADAIEELEHHAPDAAAWWRIHAPPSKTSWLVFEKECCLRLP